MMSRRKNSVLCLLLVFLSTGMHARAQVSAFKYKADLQKIDSAGVYRIELSPDLIARSRADLNDIRLMDKGGKNTAYVLSSKLQLSSPDRFVVLPEVNSAESSETAVVYIVVNSNSLNLNRLWLTLKRTEVSRYVNLSGSDDLKKWFAIKEDIPLQEAGTGNGPDYQQYLDFPTSDYKYFKIQVHGKHKTPVKILQAGIYTASLNVPAYDAIPPISFATKDTTGKSRLLITLPQAYQLNKLHINVTAPKYFSRRVVVSVIKRDGAEQIADTVINSSGSGDIFLSAKAKKLQVDIYNGDDNPLAIKSIEGFQTKEFAVAYLEARHIYNLYCGNTAAKPANYDLSFLNNRAYNQLPSLSHGAVHRNPAFAVIHQLQPTDHSAWLWVSIIVVLLMLCFLTFKMMREIKRA